VGKSQILKYSNISNLNWMKRRDNYLILLIIVGDIDQKASETIRRIWSQKKRMPILAAANFSELKNVSAEGCCLRRVSRPLLRRHPPRTSRFCSHSAALGGHPQCRSLVGVFKDPKPAPRDSSTGPSQTSPLPPTVSVLLPPGFSNQRIFDHEDSGQAVRM
jgi:hypothetical protein